jgi:hypothetical protein
LKKLKLKAPVDEPEEKLIDQPLAKGRGSMMRP